MRGGSINQVSFAVLICTKWGSKWKIEVLGLLGLLGVILDLFYFYFLIIFNGFVS